LALMWGRYTGSTDTQIQADVNALQSDDVLKALLPKSGANLTILCEKWPKNGL
jgi:hypothetical protein